MVCNRIVRLVLGDGGFGNFGILKEIVSEEDEEKKKFERARSQWICESECWDTEIRWIWGTWM